ncbi:MAG: hypothetical protein FWH07_03305 [Oscillospiraceae bacterium]|nr:hypothetical protein [Oscillospiraceae bacterium]
MKKIKYLIGCLFRMNFGRFFVTVRELARENKKLSVAVFFDILWCGIRYGAGYVDYRIFDFVRLSAKQRGTFVTRGINNEFIRKLNNKDDYYKFEDKSVFNALFKEFISRDWIFLKDVSITDFARFLEKNPVVIVKPVDAICGKGIEKISVAGDIAGLYDRLIQNGQTLVEEYIVQHEDLARINPYAVNTLRFMSIVDGGGEVHIMFRALRVGIEGSVVDNFNAGGMFVLLNEDGVIISDAVNKKTEMFDRHPSTAVVFKGTRIPSFKEAEEMVKRAAVTGAFEGIRYVSWDVAVTSSGFPVIIEANHNPGYDLLQSKVYLIDNEYGRLADFLRVCEKC